MRIWIRTNHVESFSNISFPSFFKITIQDSHDHGHDRECASESMTCISYPSDCDLLILHYLDADPATLSAATAHSLFQPEYAHHLIQGWIHSRSKSHNAIQKSQMPSPQLAFSLPPSRTRSSSSEPRRSVDYAYYKVDACRIGACLGTISIHSALLDLCYKIGATSKYGA